MQISESTKNIKKHLLTYLNRSMPVMDAMPPAMAKAFAEFQATELNFIKEPYLELATAYEEAAESLADLVQTGDLDKDVANAFACYLLDKDHADPKEVHLYVHQLESLREVANESNLVVSTGTGSGKTECFLLPIVNKIVKEKKRDGGAYNKHVRALILYPMNALVNDQIRRLRNLMKYLPKELRVTFGRYTSETDHQVSRMADKDKFEEMWQQFAQGGGDAPQPMLEKEVAGDEDYLECEYRYRRQWKKGGADILVTNYAMLERLLLYPNTGLFDTPWDFIVLDEAHSYSGASGTEIAWLIRRLVNRLQRGKPNHPIRFLATSATLATGTDEEKNRQAIRQFASALFPAEGNSFFTSTGKTKSFLPPNSGGNGSNVDYECAFAGGETSLYERTIAFEAKKQQHKSRQRLVALQEAIVKAGGVAPLGEIMQLEMLFESHPKVWNKECDRPLVSRPFSP